MDFELIEHALPILLLGAGVTIEITAVSVAIGFFIGLFVGIARISQMKILRIHVRTLFPDDHNWHTDKWKYHHEE